MKGYSAIVFRKWSAGLLLALLLSIQGIKLTHSHAHQGTQSREGIAMNAKGLLKPLTTSCSICQFEFVREATLPNTTIGLEPPVFFRVYYSDPYCSLYSIPHTYFFLRGPPAA